MIFWLLLGALLAYLFLSIYSTARKLPPGPFPLPLIGNFHQLLFGVIKHKNIVTIFKQWQKKYGNVYTFWMGPIATVHICDYQVAQDTMVKKGTHFADRPDIYVMDIGRDGKGIISTNGDFWQEQRRFALHTLRNFGLGRNLVYERIMLEYDYRKGILNKDIKQAGGKLTFDPYHFIELTVGNIINRMLLTDRWIEDEEKVFLELKAVMDKLIETATPLDFLITKQNESWPLIRNRKETLENPTLQMRNFLKGQVKRRQAAIASGEYELREPGEDFVDAFLLEMQKKDKGSSFTEESLYVTLLDLWGAGQETTTTTLHWALSYLVQNPQDFKSLQAEMDSVTGRNRCLNLSDKPNTPFLNATIIEALRVATLLPMNLMRTTKEDTIVGDYLIPKGTIISAQLSVINADNGKFHEPEKFNPSRFLENNNDQFVIPFGVGKRACLGESLARAELFLLLGNLALDYNISPDHAHPASMEAVTELGFVRKAKHYQITISTRDQ